MYLYLFQLSKMYRNIRCMHVILTGTSLYYRKTNPTLISFSDRMNNPLRCNGRVQLSIKENVSLDVVALFCPN